MLFSQYSFIVVLLSSQQQVDMNNKTRKLGKIKFILIEPPFQFDSNDKGAMEKLDHANKTGLGKILRESEEQQNSKADSVTRNPFCS